MNAHYVMHIVHALMYTACSYFRVRVLANKKIKIGLNLLYLFLEKIYVSFTL